MKKVDGGEKSLIWNMVSEESSTDGASGRWTGSQSKLSLKPRWREKCQHWSCPLGTSRKGGGFGKDIHAGKTEGGRKRGRPDRRRADLMQEATGLSLQELSRRTGHCARDSVTRSQSQSRWQVTHTPLPTDLAGLLVKQNNRLTWKLLPFSTLTSSSDFVLWNREEQAEMRRRHPRMIWIHCKQWRVEIQVA